MLLQGWTTAVPNSILDGDDPTIFDRCNYLGSCLTEDSDMVIELSTPISKVGAAYVGADLIFR